MKIFRKITSIIIAFGLLLSLIYIGGDAKEVQAASISYDQIEYGNRTNGNWGYILVPKGVSGKLQAGFVVHGLWGEKNATSHVKNALAQWGDKVSPMIIIMPILTYYKDDPSTIQKFKNYVYNNDTQKSELKAVVDQMNDGTFDELIKAKGYKCSIDKNKDYFVSGWSLGGSVAAYAGSKFRDIFPYVGSLSPAPSTHGSFIQADPDPDTYKLYKYSKKENSVLMMAASVDEGGGEIYHVMDAFYPFHSKGDFKYYAIEHAEHGANLFMTELFTFLYAVSHDGKYPSEDLIKKMYPNQYIDGKTYNTNFVSFPKGSNDQTPENKPESTPQPQEQPEKSDIPVIESVVPSVSNNTVKMGQYYTITVNATGSDLSYQWMWRKDKSGWAVSSCPGSNTATIQLEGKRPVVYYKCVVSNASGSVESEEIPVYLAKPVLTASVSNNTVKKGEAYTISVDVKKDKRFEYKWEYDKHKGEGWKESQIDDCRKSDTLKLTGKNPVITYKCTIIYKDGNNTFSVTSDEITITMADK